jgi:DNA repair protein RadD
MELRPYQEEALAACKRTLLEQQCNPLLVMATGAGKTIVFSRLVADFLKRWPKLRVAIVAHRKELVQQAYDKLRTVWPEAPVGIYSAGAGERDSSQSITIASIQSLVNHDFQAYNLIIVDEAHRIPFAGEGQYRQVIKRNQEQHPTCRVLGVTATPFRLDGGHLVDSARNTLFDTTAYEIGMPELIEQGYLVPLRSKQSADAPTLSNVTVRNGDYAVGEASRVMRADNRVSKTVANMVERSTGRRATLVFACDIAHAGEIQRELTLSGVRSEIVTGSDKQEMRDSVMKRFVDGTLPVLVNVDVATEGFDAPVIDCIVMMRPTKSTARYLQMLGRGTRLCDGKSDCLVLDYVGNIREHGPITALHIHDEQYIKLYGGKQTPRVYECDECGETFTRGRVECPACNAPVPSNYDAAERAEMLAEQAAQDDVLNNDPVRRAVKYIYCQVHEKPGKPESLKLVYVCTDGHRQYEFLCFAHGGYAQRKAREWWADWYDDEPPIDAYEAEERIDCRALAQRISAIMTQRDERNPKYHRVVGYDLREVTEPLAPVATDADRNAVDDYFFG